VRGEFTSLFPVKLDEPKDPKEVMLRTSFGLCHK
jgi:hypothetical protein